MELFPTGRKRSQTGTKRPPKDPQASCLDVDEDGETSRGDLTPAFHETIPTDLVVAAWHRP